MRPLSLLLPFAAVVALSSALVGAETSAAFSFSIQPDNNTFDNKEHQQQEESRKRLRRKRHLKSENTNPSWMINQDNILPQKKATWQQRKSNEDLLLEEGESHEFWNRVLKEENSMNTKSPTFAPRPEPEPEPAPIAPAQPQPVPAPVPAPAPEPANRCNVGLEIECVAVDGSQACIDIAIPDNNQDCEVDVEYSYNFVNNGDSEARVYAVGVSRGGDTTDITTTVPVVDLKPQETTTVLQNAQLDLCSDNNALDTEVAFTVGPPSDVRVSIACASSEGDECRTIPAANNPDECMIDITYTYTVTNIGNVDANIVLFTRTRNGDFKDLLDDLEGPSYLPLGADVTVQETEEIDRCVQQSFATNTVVAQSPNADLLCDDVGFYP